MKTNIFLLLLLASSLSFSQSKLKKDNVLGDWKLHIEVEQELEKELEENDFFEDLFAKGVLGFAQAIVDRIDIRLEFKKNQKAILTIETNIVEKEVQIETLDWSINSKGNLVLDDIDNDKVNIDDDGYWKLKDSKTLIYYDKDGMLKKNIYMKRID